MTPDLTLYETKILSTLSLEWTNLPDLTDDAREAIDYLVLSGLVERMRLTGDATGAAPSGWAAAWRQTDAGASLSAPESQPDPAPSERPKPVSVGSLVRHMPSGGLGLIVDHFMWDHHSGGFHVEFTHEITIPSGAVLKSITDRYDKFEQVTPRPVKR
jgi:hypothetical protein